MGGALIFTIELMGSVELKLLLPSQPLSWLPKYRFQAANSFFLQLFGAHDVF